jgi:hypothetical protein
MGNGYVLNVGTTRFHVRDRYITRLTVPKSAYEETCFYPLYKACRKRRCATALLQLTNNPALFDEWATQNGLAFKADGQVFALAQ